MSTRSTPALKICSASDMEQFFLSDRILIISYRAGQRGSALHRMLSFSQDVYHYDKDTLGVMPDGSSHNHYHELRDQHGRSWIDWHDISPLYLDRAITEDVIDDLRRELWESIDVDHVVQAAQGRWICLAQHPPIQRLRQIWPNATFVSMQWDSYAWFRDQYQKWLGSSLGLWPKALIKYHKTLLDLDLDNQLIGPTQLDLQLLQSNGRFGTRQDKKQALRHQLKYDIAFSLQDSRESAVHIDAAAIWDVHNWSSEWKHTCERLSIDTAMPAVAAFMDQYLSLQWSRLDSNPRSRV